MTKPTMQGIEYRRDRKKWGFRVCRQGHTYKRYVWQTRAEAERALRKFLVDLDERPQVPKNAFVQVVGQYLIDSAMKGRSHWRVDALRYNFNALVLPFFGDLTPVSAITRKQVEQFVLQQKKRGVKNSTVWHLIADLKACLNWAVREGLLVANPATGADVSPIKHRRSVKAPLDPRVVDRAAESIKNPIDRAWFDVTRFTGMRKDEANRLQWTDINFDLSMIRYPGTKTEESNVWLPLAPVALATLRELRKQSDLKTPVVFPGRSAQTKGKKIYSRLRMFERIQRVTGIKLIPKDLRDYFASEIAARLNDPAVVMRLLRHTNLQTTTRYLRVVEERMQAAVQTLGASLGGGLDASRGRKTTQNDMPPEFDADNEAAPSNDFYVEKLGGSGESLTHGSTAP